MILYEIINFFNFFDIFLIKISQKIFFFHILDLLLVATWLIFEFHDDLKACLEVIKLPG